MIVRIAMKQQQRRPRTAMAQANDGAFGAHIEMLEAGEQSRSLRAAPARRITRIIGGGSFGQNGRGLCQRGRSQARGCGARSGGGRHLHQMTPAQSFSVVVVSLKKKGHFSSFYFRSLINGR